MIVVADTSPINYVVLIEQIGILPRLYTRVLIPPAVFDELTHSAAPNMVRDWTQNHPAWLEILGPKNTETIAQLDLGESHAIALATEMGATAVLIDEQAGRQEAARRGLNVAGTLAVLDEADQSCLLNFDEAVDRLRKTSFRLSQAVLAEIQQKRSR
jgi:predicted nucleic acid-binding protein